MTWLTNRCSGPLSLFPKGPNTEGTTAKALLTKGLWSFEALKVRKFQKQIILLLILQKKTNKIFFILNRKRTLELLRRLDLYVHLSVHMMRIENTLWILITFTIRLFLTFATFCWLALPKESLCHHQKTLCRVPCQVLIHFSILCSIFKSRLRLFCHYASFYTIMCYDARHDFWCKEFLSKVEGLFGFFWKYGRI